MFFTPPPFMATAVVGPTVNAVDFDGTNDYLSRGAALTSLADSATGILSVWVRFDGGDSSNQRFLNNATARVYAGKTGAGNVLQVSVSDGTKTLTFSSTTTYTASATWLHVLASWDTNYSAGNKIKHLYVNDVSDLGTVADAGAAFNAYYNDTNWYVGSNAAGSLKLNGCMAEFYFAPGQYLDFSNSSNRRKFINSLGKPVDLGSDGSTPTGVAPKVYLKDVAASFGTNSGTGGNFTITGTLDTASTSPSD